MTIFFNPIKKEDLVKIERDRSIRILLGISILFTVVVALAIAAQGSQAQAMALPAQKVDLIRSGNLPFDLLATETITSHIFLPGVLNQWFTPCGAIPYLVSPADGSTITSNSTLVFDGGYRGDDLNWLEIEFNPNSSFVGTGKSYVYQPAAMLWQQEISFFNLTPGKWYWRTSIWCNGPGWPPPPGYGYVQSPFSQVWSFTLK
jgi:hypothetical protein